MQIYMEEKIGNPELFTGRTKELSGLLQWAENIKRKLSNGRREKSRAVCALRGRIYRWSHSIF
jgi:hypothetical protein